MTVPLHMNFKDLQRVLTVRLKDADIETPGLDVRIFFEEATGLSRADIIACGNDIVPVNTAKILETYTARRIAGEPIDFILGHREFYGRRFEISKYVLSPRPETEGIIDLALRAFKGLLAPRILDLGTGSGAVLITLLKELGGEGVGTDISSDALNVAKTNATVHGVAAQSNWRESDWFENIGGTFDLIVSNPPYITNAAMDTLPGEVSGFDPDIALRGGVDGLTAYADILAGLPDYLNPGGIVILEIGFDQGCSVPAMMRACGLTDVTVHADLSGHDRIITGLWPQK